MILLTMLIIPIMISLGFFLFGGHKVTFWEFVTQNLIQLGIMAGVMMILLSQNTADVEIWNGRVASKNNRHVSCSHSYPCNCHSVSCGKNCRTMRCSTCYMHRYDVNWEVHTSNQETISISRIDSQGLREPPRWSQVRIGEPTSIAHSYENYVKGSPNSLFHNQGLTEKYQKSLKSYPGDVYDYYRLDRLVNVNGVTIPDHAEWNRDLTEINADLGTQKQVNVAVVVVKNQPAEYFYALQQSWIGGKKNDFILIIGVNDMNRIIWSEVMAWTNNKVAEVVVRDAILNIGILDRPRIISALSDGVKTHYVRRSMKDFEYLKNSVKPTVGQWIFAMLFGLTVAVGLGIFMVKNEFQA